MMVLKVKNDCKMSCSFPSRLTILWNIDKNHNNDDTSIYSQFPNTLKKLFKMMTTKIIKLLVNGSRPRPTLFLIVFFPR